MEGSNLTFTATSRPRRRSRAARIWIGILVGVVAGNALAAGTYLAMSGIANDGSTEPAPAKGASAPRPGALSTAHRIAGLEAMDRGEYDVAVTEFMRALRDPNPSPDLPQLLSIAQELKDQSAKRKKGNRTAVRTNGAPKGPQGIDPAPRRVEKKKKADAQTEERSSRPKRRANRTANAAKQPKKSPAAVPKRQRPAPRPAAAAPPAPAAKTTALDDRDPDTSDGSSELPLCPKDYVPPAPTTPYGLLPKRCRPRNP